MIFIYFRPQSRYYLHTTWIPKDSGVPASGDPLGASELGPRQGASPSPPSSAAPGGSCLSDGATAGWTAVKLQHTQISLQTEIKQLLDSIYIYIYLFIYLYL